MADIYFKKHNRAGLINSKYTCITGEIEVSNEMAIELIKSKKARLVLGSGYCVPFDIIKEAVGGAGAAILPNKVIAISDAIQPNSSVITIVNRADVEIKLDDDFIAVIKQDMNNLEIVSYKIDIGEDNEVIVKHKGPMMTICMFSSRSMNKLTSKSMHDMIKNGIIVRMYDLGIISY